MIGRQGVVQGEGGAGCGAGQVQSEFGTGAVWYRPDVVQVQTHVGISQMSL